MLTARIGRKLYLWHQIGCTGFRSGRLVYVMLLLLSSLWSATFWESWSGHHVYVTSTILSYLEILLQTKTTVFIAFWNAFTRQDCFFNSDMLLRLLRSDHFGSPYELTRDPWNRPDPATIRAVADFAQPHLLKQGLSFLCPSSCFRQFVPEYASKAKPLKELFKKGEKFVSGADQEACFYFWKHCELRVPCYAVSFQTCRRNCIQTLPPAPVLLQRESWGMPDCLCQPQHLCEL